MHVLPHESSYAPRRNHKKKSLSTWTCAEYMPRGTKKTRAANRHARTHARAVPDVGSEGLLQEQAQDQGTVWHHFHVGKPQDG